jgi:hypothetical protein
MSFAQDTFMEIDTTPYRPAYNRKARVLCVDGKVRAAVVHNVPELWFATSARVKVNGKTVTGYVTVDDINDDRVLIFHAYTYRKNGGLLAG